MSSWGPRALRSQQGSIGIKTVREGNSLSVRTQQGAPGSITGRGTKIPQAARRAPPQKNSKRVKSLVPQTLCSAFSYLILYLLPRILHLWFTFSNDRAHANLQNHFRLFRVQTLSYFWTKGVRSEQLLHNWSYDSTKLLVFRREAFTPQQMEIS